VFENGEWQGWPRLPTLAGAILRYDKVPLYKGTEKKRREKTQKYVVEAVLHEDLLPVERDNCGTVAEDESKVVIPHVHVPSYHMII